MIAHLHASVNFFIYGFTNKSLRTGKQCDTYSIRLTCAQKLNLTHRGGSYSFSAKFNEQQPTKPLRLTDGVTAMTQLLNSERKLVLRIMVFMQRILEVMIIFFRLRIGTTLKTYNDATLQLVSLTNKSLRTGYHDFVVRRLCGVCCAAMAVDRSAISTDQTLASRSRASFRSYDVARTSRPGRKAIVETSTVVYRPSLSVCLSVCLFVCLSVTEI